MQIVAFGDNLMKWQCLFSEKKKEKNNITKLIFAELAQRLSAKGQTTSG